MSESESTKSNATKSHVNHKLEAALKVVCKNWIPVNGPFMVKIVRSLTKGKKYDLEALVADLKRDFSLFTFCLKKTLDEATEDEIPVAERINPIAILKKYGFTKLRQLILEHACHMPSFDPAKVDKAQVNRSKETVTSASAIEIVSQQFNLDHDQGFSVGLLRQLGVTLIAWNYPKEYNDALFISKRKSISIDDALTRELGFSPKLLGLQIISSWGLSPEILAVIDTSFSNKSKNLDFNEGFLFKVCEIGEAYARVVHDVEDKQAQVEWERTQVELEDTFGKNGFAQLQEQMQNHVETYDPLGTRYEQIRNIGVDKQRIGLKMLRENPYVDQCPEFIRCAFESLYGGIHTRAMSDKALRILAKEIVPNIGFINGCVYILEQETMALRPRFQLGDYPLEKFPALDFIEDNAAHPIATAFFQRFPAIMKGKCIDNRHVTYIAAPIGKAQSAGVLYLECSDEMLAVPGAEPLLYYKAINKALTDCLNA